ncbi:LD-carboxypeptidase [Putridiphycobacter roseus]|uniref:LD-carboxypeptidase n=1 Tax=Putridiphycobacter roseus TaxID=2219161 RepID=A0A2W1NBX6_9FLAO|nr:LD-carboxypeptidase [Putridiphycobacter roseus]PZE16583.1 LD-carboxypeptidase [Putridiphycobacter roseus]
MERRKFIVQAGIIGTSLLGLSAISLPEFTDKIFPKALKQGDTIALTAPAGAIFSPTYIDKISNKLKSFGFKVVQGKTLFEKYGYLAGKDELRATEINNFFKDKNIAGIFTLRGGWGCGRILDLIDYETIRQNPKIIMGFSDITALLIAIYKKTGLVTFHGPMGYSSWNDFSTEQVFDTLVLSKRVKFENAQVEKTNLKTLSKGRGEGEILAGNLTVLCSLIGTAFEPDWTNKILCLEEIGEEPYRIDRMFWQLKMAGVFEAVNGIILGSFRKCEPEFPSESFSLMEVFKQYFEAINVPVFMGASFGHTVNKFNLPIGVKAVMNTADFQFQLLENPTQLNR